MDHFTTLPRRDRAAPSRKARIVIVDDHTLFRQALRSLLEREPDLAVVGEAGDGEEAVRRVRSLRPDIVLMDLLMPGMGGVEATTRIVGAAPNVKVVALTMHRDASCVDAMLRAGARGFVVKESASSELVEAIRVALKGGAYLHPTVSGAVISRLLNPERAPERAGSPESLSLREREVLRLIAEGLTSKEIAARLSIAVKTVVNHRTHLMSKLNIHSIARLVRYALAHGIINPREPPN